MLSRPRFRQDAARRIKERTIAAIKLSNQDPETVAKNAFYKAAYRTFAYAHPEIGTIHDIENITNDDMANYYKQFYVDQNMTIVMVGDINDYQARKIANDLASAVPEGQQAPLLMTVPYLNKPITVHIPFQSKQESIIIGKIGLAFKAVEPFNYPLRVANYILGGGGMTSILFKQVRDNRGLAYYAYSQLKQLRFRGPFMIRLKTKADQTKKAISVVKAALTHFVHNGPTSDQLASAKEAMINSLPLSISTNKKILDVVTRMAYHQRPLDMLDKYASNVNAVTLREIQRALKYVLDVNFLVTVTVGPVDPSK